MDIDWRDIRYDGSHPYSTRDSKRRIPDLYRDKDDYEQQIADLRRKIDER